MPTSRRGNAAGSRWPAAYEGALLGTVAGMAVHALGGFRMVHLPDVFASGLVVGGLLGAIGAVIVPRVCAALLVTFVGVIAWTPLASVLMQNLDVAPGRGAADAAVVLSSDVHSDGTPDAQMAARMARVETLLRDHAVRNVVLTSGAPVSGVPAARRELAVQRLGAVVHVAGAVHNTHDEALAVSPIVRANHWKAVYLVTQAWHLRRAMATFRRAGIRCIAAPADETRFDVTGGGEPDGRLACFREWLRETVGYDVYKARGWLKP